jgi:hypothetical protein
MLTRPVGLRNAALAMLMEKIKNRPDFSSERAPHITKSITV